MPRWLDVADNLIVRGELIDAAVAVDVVVISGAGNPVLRKSA
jgi:hypothetical protein